jgi:hypothetical protein
MGTYIHVAACCWHPWRRFLTGSVLQVHEMGALLQTLQATSSMLVSQHDGCFAMAQLKEHAPQPHTWFTVKVPAPAHSSSRTTRMCPPAAATCSAVLPSYSSNGWGSDAIWNHLLMRAAIG